MGSIDPGARIEAGAVIGRDAAIGPFCVVGPNAVIEDGARLVAHVHIAGHTTVGARTVVYPFASLGTPPQSLRYRGGATRLVIGADCDIREAVTMNIGTEDGGGLTRVGDRCFFMAGSHVGHDSTVGSDVTFANNAVIGGHVSVGDFSFIGGNSAVHQFCRIGESVMIGGVSSAREDVIPFGFVFRVSELVGLNTVGLKRRGIARADIHRLRRAYRMLFFAEGTFATRLESVAREFQDDPIVGKVVTFIREGGNRSLMKPRPMRAAPASQDDDRADA